MTVPEAATRLGVTTSAAYNWVAASRKTPKPSGAQPPAGTAFARLVPSAAADSGMVVRVGGAEVLVRRGFDGDLLQAVVATLAEGTR